MTLGDDAEDRLEALPSDCALNIEGEAVEGNPLHALTSPYAFAELHASAEL